MKKRLFLIFLLTFGFTALDQLSKFLIISHNNDIVFIQNYLKFHLEINKGAAFSLPIPNLLIIFITLVLIFVSIYFCRKYFNLNKITSQIVICIFFAGAIGNLIDRCIYSGVIDFIDIWFYPVFNIADIYLTFSVFYILLFYGKIQRT
jgi:signal peptidase II